MAYLKYVTTTSNIKQIILGLLRRPWEVVGKRKWWKGGGSGDGISFRILSVCNQCIMNNFVNHCLSKMEKNNKK